LPVRWPYVRLAVAITDSYWLLCVSFGASPFPAGLTFGSESPSPSC
jgi:hypothetical protein